MVHNTKLYTKQQALNESVNLVYAGEFSKAIRLIKKHYTVNSYKYKFFKGWICQLEGKHEQAVKWFEQSLERNPINEYALEGLVASYLALEQYYLALECAEQLVTVAKDAKNLFSLATSQSYYYRGDKARLASTLNTFNEAYELALQEGNLELLKDILIGWGACLVDLRRFEEAKIVLETVKLQDSQNILIHKNLASVYSGLNMTERAIESCNIAKLSEDPNIANDALYQLGMLELMRGNYRLGWRLHEFRTTLAAFDATPTREVPQWTGKPLPDDNRILLYQEQGLGDTIQFSRYIREVKTRVKNIDLMIHANTYVNWDDSTKEPNSLKALLKENYPELNNIWIKGWNTVEYKKYNYICSLMSLPRVFKTTLSNIPSIPYLKTSVSSTLKMHDIGLFWKGSAIHANDENRSIPTEYINSFISENKDKTFINLQLDRDEDLNNFDNVTNAKTLIKDFTDTLSILKKCRLIVAVDSMIAHMAGSANIPTIVLHANAPDWRWLEDRRDSPWYPSIINIRQTEKNNWIDVLNAAQEEINSLYQSEIIID